MSQLILGVHSGSHDAAAALFEDYELKAAISLERLTRNKGDGTRHPDLAIDEVLSIAGATRRDVDVVCYSRSLLPTKYFRHITGIDWLKEQYRTHVARKPRRQLMPELFSHHSANTDEFFDVAAFQRDSGFRSDASPFFYNHHEAHALPALFYSPDWDDALIVTADGGGDNVHYSHRHFADGKLRTIYGGEETILTPAVEDSLGKMYGAATKALGFRRVRHEGKVTGLVRDGQAGRSRAVAGEILRRREWPRAFDAAQRQGNQFLHARAEGKPEQGRLFGERAAGAGRHHAAVVRAAARPHPAKHLGVSGGMFANVKLNRLLAEKFGLERDLRLSGDGRRRPAGRRRARLFCCAATALETWLNSRRDLGPVYLGRDYTDVADAALSKIPGVCRTAEGPVEGAVAAAEGRTSSARSIPAAWNTARARSAPAPSLPIRRGARPMTCSTTG